MALSDKQWDFLKDVAMLIYYIESQGWKATGGELWRPQVMQDYYLEEGKSTVRYSNHQDRLAIDLNFFNPDGDLTYDKDELQMFGDFWESLHPDNEWGGNWKTFLDCPHFQRNK